MSSFRNFASFHGNFPSPLCLLTCGSHLNVFLQLYTHGCGLRSVLIFASFVWFQNLLFFDSCTTVQNTLRTKVYAISYRRTAILNNSFKAKILERSRWKNSIKNCVQIRTHSVLIHELYSWVWIVYSFKVHNTVPSTPDTSKNKQFIIWLK